MEDVVISKEPWPEKGIEHYRSIENGPWGYLVHYQTKGFVFEIHERPTAPEILERWGDRLK